ncbi:HTH domain-containing protein [Mesorhizobium sp.]|uniref:HTH domain-containing protein n=1 Tax=Mesorhizobium sp. TaxID=1871066 RepID=UPI000FEA34E2|nr:HTH domain-containing protein [Mesorhizobium sp.]RWM29455.1 MAG: HTH domain-containing protein [Mesorhizobium sp.]
MAKIVALLESGISTAEKMAAENKASLRQTYRDIAALKAIGMPIEGEAGLGYALRVRKGAGLSHG